jgi:alkylresorcinol/alkylpyrone synthase
MATIAATATAHPAYALRRDQLKEALKNAFDLPAEDLSAILSVFYNAGVEQRYFVQPLEYLVKPRPLDQVSREYAEAAIELASRVAGECLAQAGKKPEDIDYLITTSCTGVMIPSVDAHLVNAMGFRPDVRRLPITELGCAAGAVALSRARDFVKAYPQSNVLVVAVELPSLTFQRRDISMANMVSSAIFGDGAAAVLVTGEAGEGPAIVDTLSYQIPDSIEAMGFDLKDGGLHIVLAKEVPDLIRDHIHTILGGFLKRHNLTREHIRNFMLHPGGKKILNYLEEELALTKEDTDSSWHVLKKHGNMSSASILYVLQQALEKRKAAKGDYGLMAAFGPGFSAEVLLLRWA